MEIGRGQSPQPSPAELKHSSDCEPGIERIRTADGFVYRNPDGGSLGRRELARIDALKIPPAWTDVWICTDPFGHLQATGRDARGRKQYLYHARWREVRDADKFDRMIAFAEALPSIRARVDTDLNRRKLSRERVLGAVVGIMDRTLVRVGNAEYMRANDTYGLTTLKSDHIEMRPDEVRLRFRGKSGKTHSLCVDEARIVRAIRGLRELPGQELFQYVDSDGRVHDIGSADVNAYLRESAGGGDMTSKDFRTWGGTLIVAEQLSTQPVPKTVQQRERMLTAAVHRAAQALGNTPAVCRRSYVHPQIVELYIRDGVAPLDLHSSHPRQGLSASEAALRDTLVALASRKASAAV